MTPRPPPVLLNVDDNEIARYARSRTLRHAGFEVLEADSGTQALASLEAREPALVLLDVQLPDIDGFEVARRLTSDGHGPNVVLVSSRELTDYGSLVDDSGARGFLPKNELTGAAVAAVMR